MTATTIYDTRRDTLSVTCPRCKAQPGINCRTPNGHLTVHQVRINAGQGKPATTATQRRRRLSDAQAQRIEWAAETGKYTAPDQYATLRGEAKERTIADALERHGYIRQLDGERGATPDGYRVFELTEAGWAAYHSDPMVIQRLPNYKHPDICPCRAKEVGYGPQNR